MSGIRSASARRPTCMCRPPLSAAHCKPDPIYEFPEMKQRGLIPNFHIHVTVSDLYIPTMAQPILLQQNSWTNRYRAFAVQVPGSTLDPTRETLTVRSQTAAKKVRQNIKLTAWPLR